MERTTSCPSCSGAGFHDVDPRPVTCATCEGAGRVANAPNKYGDTLEWTSRYCAEWNLRESDYLDAAPLVAHLDDRSERNAAWAVAVHALTSLLGDAVRLCATCSTARVWQGGDCDECAESNAFIAARQRRHDAYVDACDQRRKAMREEAA